MFELLNHLHKRAAYLGKGKNFAKRTCRPLSKDQNISKKTVFKKHHRKGHQLRCSKNCPLRTVALFSCPKLPSFLLFFVNGNSFFALKPSSNHVFFQF
jgi:hypothetical protein